MYLIEAYDISVEDYRNSAVDGKGIARQRSGTVLSAARPGGVREAGPLRLLPRRLDCSQK
ncbi:hypothetical protein CEW87_03475 [Parazoarcus communis]|jgi:hypothetical protein|uniref:Uncharacterized protein n=1 Tax=Parazoarcus communis TaxID=41977 RepID=A0A2U8GYF0_9RHOO|nr:hypothetical protein [Parazoarcus communis]AWI78498.1 hypothetical protein CEW87_03475 [Parazoarcus communis]